MPAPIPALAPLDNPLEGGFVFEAVGPEPVAPVSVFCAVPLEEEEVVDAAKL
jgi:hypothetical protein